MITLNWIAITVLILANWIGGAVWFGPLFGKLWMRIHHGNKKFTPEQQKEMMKGMWKLMTAELIASAMMIGYLASLIAILPEYSPIQIAFSGWFGFVLPMTISNILWGNDPKKYMFLKIVLSSGFRLIALLLSAIVLSAWK